jgi:class 3 adenylate cyclase
LFLPAAAFYALGTWLNSGILVRDVRERYQVPLIEERAREAASLMVADLLETDEASRILELGQKVALLTNDPTVEWATVTDAGGRSVFDSAGRTLPSDLSLDGLRTLLTRPTGSGRYECVVPVASGAHVVGYLKTGFSDRSLARPFARVKRGLWLTAGALVAGMSVFLWAAAWWFTRPVRDMVRDFIKVAQRQNLASRVPERGVGEIRLLLRGYNRLKDALQDMQSTEQLLGRFVSPKVAEMLLEDRLDVRPQKRRITVLNVDIEKFSDYTSRHTAEDVARMVGDFWDIVELATEEFGGTVDKHVGDAVICLWGAPLEQADTEERAVRCLFDIERRVAAWNAARQMADQERISFWSSIATGSCIAGNMGKGRMEYTALGNTMNIAPRIMTKAHELGVYKAIDGFTHEKVSALVDAADRGEHLLRGVKGPIRIFELKGLRAPSATAKN